jgi:transcriptional regulator with XRE-family HTH domain
MTGAPPDLACAVTTPPVDEVTEQDFRVSLGLRLRLMRVARRLSQGQLANIAGIHRTVVGSIERGEVNFGVAYLPRLADALGVSASWLLPDTNQSGRTGQDWETAFIAKALAARGPYVPHDLVVALDAAPLATVEAFLNELEARAGENIPAEDRWAL